MKLQQNKKIAEFHYKLLHKILPSQENLYKWKILNSENCRFGCNEKGSYQHMFLTCQYISPYIKKLENILQVIGFHTKLTYRILLFGYKAIYPAYDTFNTLLSNIFLALYRYWLHDNKQVDLNMWLPSHLNLQKKIYEELKDKRKVQLFDDVIIKWN